MWGSVEMAMEDSSPTHSTWGCTLFHPLWPLCWDHLCQWHPRDEFWEPRLSWTQWSPMALSPRGTRGDSHSCDGPAIQHFTNPSGPSPQTECCTVYPGAGVCRSAKGQRCPLWWQRSERRERDTDYWSTYIIGNCKFMGTGWSSGIQSYSGDRGKMLRQLFARRVRHNKWNFKEGNIQKGEEKKREKKRAKKNRELIVKQKRKQRMQNSEGWANFKWVLF